MIKFTGLLLGIVFSSSVFALDIRGLAAGTSVVFTRDVQVYNLGTANHTANQAYVTDFVQSAGMHDRDFNIVTLPTETIPAGTVATVEWQYESRETLTEGMTVLGLELYVNIGGYTYMIVKRSSIVLNSMNRRQDEQVRRRLNLKREELAFFTSIDRVAEAGKN